MTPGGRASLGSASIPSAVTASAVATAQAAYPRQCVMLPTMPGGHNGSPSGPLGIATTRTPRRVSASRAHARPVVNSRRRLSTARPRASRSDAYRSMSSRSALVSAHATDGGTRCSSTRASPSGFEAEAMERRGRFPIIAEVRCARPVATFGLLLGCVLAATACGGGGSGSNQDNVPRYRPGVKLDLQRSNVRTEGPLRVEDIQYSSVDGQRVPGLFAVPTERPPVGCLIFVPGFALPKEALPEVREGVAKLGLATFVIDARSVGARGSVERATGAVRDAEGVRAMLLGTVADLRVGLDWLARRPECHSNIAVLGTSFGGMVATHLAAQDKRIKAAVLTSVGATYRQAILMRPFAAKVVPNLPDYVAGAAEDPGVLQHAVQVLGPYDLERWIGKISPRPVMLINGRFDPIVAPADALQLAAAARSPKTVLYSPGGHDPFAKGPGHAEVTRKATEFLTKSLHLPAAGG